MVVNQTNALRHDYEAFVDELVLSEIKRGIVRFDILLTSLPGIYPSVVLTALWRLVSAGKISQDIAVDISKQARQQDSDGSIKLLRHRIILPIQHPLDFEWRFSDKATANLLQKAEVLTKPEHTIALLGSPSILRTALEIDYPRSLVLLDANPVILKSLAKDVSKETIVLCDISKDELPELSAGVVIVDPPWYEEYIRSFLWAACRVCLPGGHLLVSFPPVGTRPGIGQEIDDVLQWAQNELGLSLISLEKADLPYETPLFERNALRAEGIHNVPFEWRYGDLAVLHSKGHSRSSRPKISATSAPSVIGDEWSEERLWGVRIRIRKTKEESLVFRDPYLESIVLGDVLPSVSRRDPRRELADVWTSGNRIFACDGRQILEIIVRSLEAEKDPIQELLLSLGRTLNEDELHLVHKTTQRITEIARIERDENFLYSEDLNDARLALTTI